MSTKFLIPGIAVLLNLAAVSAWALDPRQGTAPATRPPEELAAQKLLPKVRDELWTKLLKCPVDYDKDRGTYSIRLTPEVKALDGKAISVRGFVLPMDGSDHTRHFLISRNTPVCLYCPPGQPNEVIEVEVKRAIPWTNKIVAVSGTLHLIDDEEKALFFKIEKAEAK